MNGRPRKTSPRKEKKKIKSYEPRGRRKAKLWGNSGLPGLLLQIVSRKWREVGLPEGRDPSRRLLERECRSEGRQVGSRSSVVRGTVRLVRLRRGTVSLS